MKRLITIILLLLIPCNLYAIDFGGIISQQNRVIQNQERIEREKLLQQELRRIEIERQNIAKIARKKKLSAEEFADDGKIIQNLSKIQCFRINKINFTKNKILSKKEEEFLKQKYLGRCLIIEQIEYLTKEINNYLLKKDFTTSKAILPKQDISSKSLEIQIIEGLLEDLVFNNDGFVDKMQKFSAFGVVNKGQVLNLQDVEIGLDQINRLASNAASVKVFAGSKENSSIIFVENKAQDKIRLTLSIDDNGSEITGKKRDVLGLSYDNLFNLNDNFNFSRAANDFDSKVSRRKGNFVGYNYSIPFKRNLFSLSYSEYSYSFFAQGDSGSRSSGTSISKTIAHDLILIKTDKYKITSNLSLLNREIENFSDGQLTPVSSRKASVGSFGFSNILFFDKASLLLKPSYVKGLRILNAKKDEPDIRKQEAHGQFDAFKFYANYSHNLEIPIIKIPFNYNLNFDSQIAKKTLYSNDQIFAGGPFSVRGFESGSISGDSGYIMRNELKFNAAKLFNSQKIPQFLNNFWITPFYDYGHVKLNADNSSGRVSGAGFKVNFNHKNIDANLTYAWSVSKSALLEQDYNENQALYFNISTEIGFF